VSSLEEREREETFRLKWLKTKMENKEEQALVEA
jgi:vacuolar-type H+-ATPase subunit D/Vma8